MSGSRRSAALRGCALLCTVLAGCAGDDGNEQADASPDQKLRLDAPLPARLEAKISPSAVLFGQTITLELLAFNFRLIPVDQPSERGKGHCLVSLLIDGEDKGATSLFKVSSRKTQFRLNELAMLDELQPGQHALRAQLHLNDGTAVGGEAKVDLPLLVCDREPCSPQ